MKKRTEMSQKARGYCDIYLSHAIAMLAISA